MLITMLLKWNWMFFFNSLWKYNTLFQHFGDEAEVNDHDMIEDAVTIVFFPKEASKKVGVNGNIGGWQVIQSFEAKPTLS